MVGMVSHPPTARGTWSDTWHEEEVSKYPPGWLCDWRVLETLSIRTNHCPYGHGMFTTV